MLFGLFGKKQNRCLGIDFGSSGIKIVELSRDEKNRLVLQNYIIGQTKIDSKFGLSKLDADVTAKILKELLDQAGISGRQAVVSLSVGETFSTIIDLPFMSEAELTRAIPFEAQKYVPVPIEEVVLDWSVVRSIPDVSSDVAKSVPAGRPTAERPAAEIALPSGKPVPTGQGTSDQRSASGNVGSGTAKLQVLIVAVPKDLIKKIAQIAKKLSLKILAVEQEAFSIVRSLVGKDEEPFLIIDFGQENIDFILVDKNSIKLTYTFEVAKKPDLIFEAGKMINLFQSRYHKKIAKIILTGGRASLPVASVMAEQAGQSPWALMLGEKLKIPAGLGDPFARLSFEQKLAPALKEIAPFMAVAVGGAMREL